MLIELNPGVVYAVIKSKCLQACEADLLTWPLYSQLLFRWVKLCFLFVFPMEPNPRLSFSPHLLIYQIDMYYRFICHCDFRLVHWHKDLLIVVVCNRWWHSIVSISSRDSFSTRWKGSELFLSCHESDADKVVFAIAGKFGQPRYLRFRSRGEP